MNELIKYLDSDGKINVYPSKQNNKKIVLTYLASKFENNRIYHEKEVNELICQFHSFNDYFLLRRELIEHHLLARTRNGARYWKSDLLPIRFETNHLIVRNTYLEDESALIEVCQSNDDLKQYTGHLFEVEEIHNILTKGDLPPEGFKEFYQCKTIVSKENQEVIGYFDLYRGYPSSDTLWISTFYIHKNFQQKGYGYEVIQSLLNEIKNCQFNKIALGVHLKNWQGLRFWIKNGFKTISGIYGDRNYSEEHFSIIALEQLIQVKS